MKTYLKFFITLVIVGMIIHPAMAQSNKKQPSIWDQVQTRWEVVKKKAVEYYNVYYEKYFNEQKTATNQASKNRAPTSEQIIQQKSKELVQELPTYSNPNIKKSTEEFKAIAKEVSQQKAVEVVPGRQADPNLRKRKSGVATFDAYETNKKGQKKLKPIPVIDIGIEDQISSKQFQLQLPKIFELQFDKVKELNSPVLFSQNEVNKLLNEKLEKAQVTAKFENIKLALPKEISQENIKAIVLTLLPSYEVIELAYTPFSESEIQFLKGMILTEYKDRCHLGTGLLHPLKDLPKPAQELRDYYYGSCLYKMGFHSDGTKELLKVVKTNSPWAKQAISILVSDYKREFVPEMSEVFRAVPSSLVPEKEQHLFNYVVALGESIKQSWSTAKTFAVKVDTKSTKYIEAQYLASVAEYMLGEVKTSLDRQEKLLALIEARKTHPQIHALLKMNIGRTAYRNKNYKKAIESYKFIGKESTMWIQALTELGWMQILSGDAPGAVGNMFSIQMPKFKDIYKPESYVVRTIGYLNICQYGDAYKTMEHLTKIYKPWIDAMKEENNKKQFNYTFYDNVIKSLKSGENLTSLPFPIVREIARHRDFLNVQEAINNRIDEEAQYPFIKNLAQKDKSTNVSRKSSALSRAKDLEGKIKKASSADDTLKLVGQWRAARTFELELAEYLDYESKTIDESLKYYDSFSKQSLANLRKSKEDLKSLAGRTMKSRLASMQKRLEKLIENNEFLTYEIYSGSGENIRYVSAGGNVKGTESTRKVASKSNKGKLYLWDFDGEYWADEIGNYKSSLKDNCPNLNQLQRAN